MTSIVRHGPPPRYYQLREIIREMVRVARGRQRAEIPSERELSEMQRRGSAA